MISLIYINSKLEHVNGRLERDVEQTLKLKCYEFQLIFKRR